MIRSATVLTLLLILLSGCSLAPEQPVTRLELMNTRIYNKYIIEESPEELLYALNTRGELVIEAKRGERNIYLKLLATADKLEVLEYDR